MNSKQYSVVDSTQCSSSRGNTKLQKRGEEEEEMLNILEKTLKQMGKKELLCTQDGASSNGASSCIDVIFIRA